MQEDRNEDDNGSCDIDAAEIGEEDEEGEGASQVRVRVTPGALMS